jgi:hypothetical protein
MLQQPTPNPLSLTRHCQLPELTRTALCYPPAEVSAEELEQMASSTDSVCACLSMAHDE